MKAVQISMKAVMQPYETLFRRHAANPILTGKDWPYSINSVFNAGATLLPNPDQYPEEIWGIEDPRITYVPELSKFAVTYTSYSRGGPGVSLALTEDFRTFERIGVVMVPDDKDAALLPRRIG